MVVFSLKSISVSLRGRHLLNDINLEIESGTSVILVGESGTGKTLLTKLLIGHIPENAEVSGSLLYKGRNLLAFSEKELQLIRGKELGYVSQNPMSLFNPFITIRAHFIATLRSHCFLSKKECLNKALANLKSVHLGHADKVLDSYPFELSGGMLQRVMLAMLLCLDTEVLILDEPTSALDLYNRDQVLWLLKMLLAKGKTLITVTHDYDLAKELGGKLILIKDGMILEEGPVDQLLKNPCHSYGKELLLGSPYERLVVDRD